MTKTGIAILALFALAAAGCETTNNYIGPPAVGVKAAQNRSAPPAASRAKPPARSNVQGYTRCYEDTPPPGAPEGCYDLDHNY